MSAEHHDIFLLQAQATQLQSTIKQMKKDGAGAAELATETEKLTALRAKVAELEKLQDNSSKFNRKAFDELILRKMYIVQSFEIHNGPAGLFDYGPAASALKANVLSLWRRHFVLEENMLEMECTCLTPSSVLETSGHVDRFTDFMVRDEVTGDCFRADKLLEDAVDSFLAAHPNLSEEEKNEHLRIQRQADAFSAEDLHDMLNKYKVMSPTNPQNKLTKPFPFNLMFKTTIGPEGTSVGFLRPETAQGLFVNFKRLLDYNQQRMPFAAAQIGLGFRNEIAPRNGLLRVREFTMAEIEHFVNPNNKRHPKFARVANKVMTLFSSEAQLTTGRTAKITIGEAVETGMVNNQTLGYFMARTQMWLEKIGVDPERTRFRQHLKTEMAHYAADCWDVEILTSYGWIECAGHADRACYDLEQHSMRTGSTMVASELLPEPIHVEKLKAVANKKLIGPRFKGDQKLVINAIENLSDDAVLALKSDLEKDGKSLVDGFEITSELASFEVEKRLVVETKYTPSVIEPSYGIGRIIHSILEHSFSQRAGNQQRCVMSFRPCVAPIKVGIFRLLNHTPFDAVIEKLKHTFLAANISNRVDSSSGSVGRRYARSDELGIPFGITVDFQTLLDNTVTLRDRDSMAQVRMPISSVLGVVQQLIDESITWDYVMSRNVVVKTGGEEADDDEDKPNNQEAEKGVCTDKPVIVEHSTRGAFSRPNPHYKP